MKTRGVYFLANDRIIEITIAFLNSFRVHNPDMPMCLIPFRDDIEKLEQLKEIFGFTIYSDRNILTLSDQISLLFHNEVTGHYRKLACWHGNFDEFVYIDVDMLVLKNIDFAFGLLNEYDFITSLSNIPEAEKWVWKPTIYDSGILAPEQISYAANTGFIVSRKYSIPLASLKERAGNAVALLPHMELYCKEQPLLNYLIVTSGLRYSSLWKLIDTELYPQNYAEYWAGNGRKNLKKGMKIHHKGKLREVFLIHWAGTWQLRKAEIKLFILLNLFKLRRKIWSVSLLMPLRRLWMRYRYLNLDES